MAFKGHYLYIHFFTRCFCQTTFTRETQPAVHAVQPLVRFVNTNSTEVLLRVRIVVLDFSVLAESEQNKSHSLHDEARSHQKLVQRH